MGQVADEALRLWVQLMVLSPLLHALVNLYDMY